MRAAILASFASLAVVAFAVVAHADDAKPAADAGTAAPASAPDDGHGSVSVKIGSDDPDDGVSAINRLPKDVRDRLTPDQIEHLLRREQDNQDRGSRATEIVVPGLFFACVLGVVIAIIMGRQRRDKMLHDTMRAMIEKGVDIPRELLVADKPKANDRRRGVILVCVGAGLIAFLYAIDSARNGAWAFGLVPLLMGVGYLVAAYVEKKSAQT